MTPPPPASYRRRGRLLLILALLPVAGVITLTATGHPAAAAILFVSVFLLIAFGTILPRVRLFGPLITRLPPDHAAQNHVCITIDDGPDPATTPQLLDLLDRHHAKAIFFLIGRKARQHPDLVRAIAARGHLIGNHSETHPSAHFWRLRPGRLWQEIAGCQQTLAGILGVAPVWFRPPVGHHNLFLSLPLRTLGLTMLIWNCRGFDGVHRHVPGILRRLARTLRPGAVILLHDATPVAAEVLEGTLQLIAQSNLKPVLIESSPFRSPRPTKWGEQLCQ